MNAAKSQPTAPWSGIRWTLVIGLIAAIQSAIGLWLAHWPELPVPKPSDREAFNLSLVLSRRQPAGSNEWLGDPRQFALPDRSGFSGFAQRALPAPEYQLAEWTAAPRWLPGTLEPSRIGSVPALPAVPPGSRSVLTATPPAPHSPTPLVLRQRTEASWRGALAQRSFHTAQDLPTIAGTDVLAPTVIEVNVSTGGAVMLTRLVSSCGNRDADQQALDWARTVWCEPTGPAENPSASDPRTWTSGRLVVTWHVAPTLR